MKAVLQERLYGGGTVGTEACGGRRQADARARVPGGLTPMPAPVSSTRSPTMMRGCIGPLISVARAIRSGGNGPLGPPSLV